MALDFPQPAMLADSVSDIRETGDAHVGKGDADATPSSVDPSSVSTASRSALPLEEALTDVPSSSPSSSPASSLEITSPQQSGTLPPVTLPAPELTALEEEEEDDEDEEDEEDQAPPPTTTMVLRGIPADFVAEDLIAELVANGFEGRFDFVHLPMEAPEHDRHAGLAYVNLRSAADAVAFRQAFHHGRFQASPDMAVLEVEAAETQGFAANVAEFSAVDYEKPWHRPLIFAMM
eukprot:TRINITY_DN33873_c0_g1_i1.p1 TRINITY_DN33873_c0_g1~~TRINITY_DN33873_c0_g1_i1.p1  ORF type:complete len:253 (+),score=73.18 TRINITY_DN33873_c0_g1_i1:59-760(+)